MWLWCVAVNLELSLCTMMHKASIAAPPVQGQQFSLGLVVWWKNHFGLDSSII